MIWQVCNVLLVFGEDYDQESSAVRCGWVKIGIRFIWFPGCRFRLKSERWIDGKKILFSRHLNDLKNLLFKDSLFIFSFRVLIIHHCHTFKNKLNNFNFSSEKRKVWKHLKLFKSEVEWLSESSLMFEHFSSRLSTFTRLNRLFNRRHVFEASQHNNVSMGGSSKYITLWKRFRNDSSRRQIGNCCQRKLIQISRNIEKHRSRLWCVHFHARNTREMLSNEN